MKLAQARLIKLQTADCLVEAYDEAELGKLYTVDLDTKADRDGVNVQYGIPWTRETILIVDEKTGDFTGWFPTEMLQILKKA